MSKPLLVFQGPVATRSGYGDHSRDLLKSLFEMDKFDIKIIPTRWGSTPQNQLDETTELGQKILSNIAVQLTQQPDVFVQVSVANEFQKLGKYNIGVTAGVETTIAPKEFIDGCNQMDLILVPSNFTKQVLEKTSFVETDRRTGQKIRDIQVQVPIEVLFEGVATDIFTGKVNLRESNDILKSVNTDFNFLYVGHWLSGDVGHDRKDTGMMIKTFCTVFKNLPKDKQPGLILKTSHAGFSVGEREDIANRINAITKEFGDKCPPIHLVWGDLLESELNELYNDNKVKAMISFTKGEGYGRPLAEFATTGKPIIVSKWSGLCDFLPEAHTIYLEGELKNVHESAQNQFLLKEAKWFYVDYTKAAQVIFDVHKNYDSYLKKSKGLSDNITTNFSLKKMTDVFKKLVDKYVKVQQKVELVLPQIKKL
jgi:glycosyltransferase involved in cell wall biosynthesis